MTRIVRRRILSGFDIYEFGIARTELAQLSTYGPGIAFLAEEFAPLVVVDHRLALPSYQLVIVASIRDRSVMQYI